MGTLLFFDKFFNVADLLIPAATCPAFPSRIASNRFVTHFSLLPNWFLQKIHAKLSKDIQFQFLIREKNILSLTRGIKKTSENINLKAAHLFIDVDPLFTFFSFLAFKSFKVMVT